MKEQQKETKVVFVLGIMPRSGTHFLANLLSQHMDCVHSLIPEDFIIQQSQAIKKTIQNLTLHWKSQLALEEKEFKFLNNILFEFIGNSVIDFLIKAKEHSHILKKKQNGYSNLEKKIILTKTPSIVNIGNFFDFFPNEKLIVIVRDGRTLVESYVNSFNVNREASIREWADAVRILGDFNINEHSQSVFVIKYEELHLNTEAKLKEMLVFLGLDLERINFEKALNLPVLGSSSFKRGKGKVHWWPVTKTNDFKPLENTTNWPRKYHERFNWLAKNELEFLGYSSKEFKKKMYFWKTYNHAFDFMWFLRKKIKNSTILLIKIYRIINNNNGGI